MPNEDYRIIIQELARSRSSQLQIFTDFCKLAACCLALCTREEEYHGIATRYGSEEMHQFSRAFAYLVNEMEAKPFTDILGEFYIEIASHSSKQARGEFFTPPTISKMIAHMIFDVDSVKSKGKPITVNEPACGSGGMVLAVAELFAPDAVDFLRVTCQDINPVATDMCFVNTTLWGIPAQVILGDTLRNTVTDSWKNPHWHRVGEDQRQAFVKIRKLMENPPEPFESCQRERKLGKIREVDGQFEMDLGNPAELVAKR